MVESANPVTRVLDRYDQAKRQRHQLQSVLFGCADIDERIAALMVDLKSLDDPEGTIALRLGRMQIHVQSALATGRTVPLLLAEASSRTSSTPARPAVSPAAP